MQRNCALTFIRSASSRVMVSGDEVLCQRVLLLAAEDSAEGSLDASRLLLRLRLVQGVRARC